MLGEKTKKNLEEAFAGESMALTKYDYYASVAKKEVMFRFLTSFLRLL
jgi:rubrerythrin